MSSRNKRNLRKERPEGRGRRRGAEREKKERKRETSVSLVNSAAARGDFQLHVVISQQEVTTQTATKCWFNWSHFDSYTGHPVVVGRSECVHTHKRAHTHRRTHTLLQLRSFVLFACSLSLRGCVWARARSPPRMCAFSARPGVRGSWQHSRPTGGLALTRMSPQAPVLVGCLLLALRAGRLYPTLGRLPGGGAILHPPLTVASPYQNLPTPQRRATVRGQRWPPPTHTAHRLLHFVPAPPSPTPAASGTHNGLHRAPNLSCISPTSKAGGKTTGHLNTVKTTA